MRHVRPARAALANSIESDRMGYSYTVYETIDAVDEAEWNRLRHGEHDPFMDVRFIRAVERSMADSSRFWHVLFRDGAGDPVASACLCSYRVDATLLADGVARTIANGVKRIAPWLLHFKVLFCGLPVSAGQSSLRFAPGVDSAAILRSLDELVMKIGRQERAKCAVFKEFSDEECVALQPLAELGYLRAESPAMNHARPEFSDFEDFCSKLPSRKRYAIRKSQKKFDTKRLRVVQMRGGDGVDKIYTDRVHRLYEAVLEKAEIKLERLSPEFFREIARQLPEQTAYTFIYDQDEIVAFAASLYTSQVFHQMFVGVDYERNADFDLYFNLFYHAVDYGFRQQVADIFCGQSADTFKERKLGCYQVPLSFFVKGVDALSAFVIRKGFNSLFPPRPRHGSNGAAEDE